MNEKITKLLAQNKMQAKRIEQLYSIDLERKKANDKDDNYQTRANIDKLIKELDENLDN